MKKIIDFLLIIFSFLAVIIPNSFQIVSISVFTLLFVFIQIYSRRVYDVYLVINWVVISLLFLGFILISPIVNSQKLELIFKYIISPFFWITIFCYIRKIYTLNFIIKWLILLGFLGNLSVLILYILMSMGYIDLIKYFIEFPNIDSNSGLGFTLHVYGNLAFFSIAMMPSMFFIKNNVLKVLYVFLFLIAALLSGRTALIVSVLLGLCLFVVYYKRFSFNLRKILIIGATSVLLSQIAYDQFTKYFDVNIIDDISSDHFSKIQESGGEERAIQTDQILKQFYNYPLGSGFVTLKIVRNELKTFDYEVLIIAVLMRFGIITFLILLISIGTNFSHLFLKKRLINSNERDFFILGFFAIILVSFTNPYLESFCFQWMFIGPIVLMKEKIIMLSTKVKVINEG